MSKDKDYYLAKGRSLEAVISYQEKLKALLHGSVAALQEFGVPATTADRLQIAGGSFWSIQSEAVARWFSEQDQKSCPLRRTPDGSFKAHYGKALWKKLRNLPRADISEFHHELCGEAFPNMQFDGKGFQTTSSIFGLEALGEQWILSCTAGGIPPYDAEPLARSVYWAMKAEAAAAEEREAVRG